MTSIAVADIETDGLLDELEVLYCGSIRDYETGENTRFRSVKEFTDLTTNYDEVWFHNGISFDYPALCKLRPEVAQEFPASKVRDTLVLSRLLFPTLASIDAAKFQKHKGSYPLPGRLTGSHSLGAWGYRLGDYKGDFSPSDYVNPETGELHTWKTVGYSEDMADYCDQDTAVTRKLLKVLLRKEYTQEAFDLEHDIAWLMAAQERNGFRFNVEEAAELYAELCASRDVLSKRLKEVYGSWYSPNGITRPKRSIKYKDKLRGDLTAGAEYTKIKRVEFNPGSRAHAVRCFKQWYGWQPTVYTEAGQAKIDAEVLADLEFPEAPLLLEYYDIAKLIGQLGDGKNAWLKKERGGYIHGRVNPNGAGTGRASHSSPNVAQVPKGAPGTYGHRCRELFTVPAGWTLLGTDASGLELRCLGHALAPYDDGEYARLVVNGDIHWHNTQALGLVPEGTQRDKENAAHEAARDLSKRWIYAFLYGAGNELLGTIVGYEESERDAWRDAGSHKSIIKRLKRRGETVTPVRVCHILKGGELRKAFLKAIPAVKEFQEDCKRSHKQDGGVTGLDGRFIKTRSAHSATNFQLQGDGALICKAWGVLLDEKLRASGLTHGWHGDYAFCAWVHDEYQIACRTEAIAHTVGETARAAMIETGSKLNVQCPLDADYQIGSNWSQTH